MAIWAAIFLEKGNNNVTNSSTCYIEADFCETWNKDIAD
jgi:hypothetical protein